MYSRKACYLVPKKTAPATMTPSTPALNFCRLVLFHWSCWWRNFSRTGRSYTIITKPLLPSQKWLLCSFKQSDCARKPHRDLMRSYSYIRETQNPATVYLNNNSISANLFRLVVPLFLHNASLLIFSLLYLTIIKKKKILSGFQLNIFFSFSTSQTQATKTYTQTCTTLHIYHLLSLVLDVNLHNGVDIFTGVTADNPIHSARKIIWIKAGQRLTRLCPEHQ